MQSSEQYLYDNAGYLRSLYFGTTSSSDPVSFLSGQINYTNTGQLSGLDIGGNGAKASVPTPVFSTALSYDGIQQIAVHLSLIFLIILVSMQMR